MVAYAQVIVVTAPSDTRGSDGYSVHSSLTLLGSVLRTRMKHLRLSYMFLLFLDGFVHECEYLLARNSSLRLLLSCMSVLQSYKRVEKLASDSGYPGHPHLHRHVSIVCRNLSL